MYNCDEQSCLHIFLRSSNIWSFIYSFAFFIIYGYITNSQCDQLPVGLIAQLVEHCTSIAEVMGSNPVQAWIFFSGFNLYITAMINHVFISFSSVQILWTFLYLFALRTLSTSFIKSVFMELANSAEFSMYLFCYRCNSADKSTAHEQHVATLIVLSFLVQSGTYRHSPKEKYRVFVSEKIWYHRCRDYMNSVFSDTRWTVCNHSREIQLTKTHVGW